jgi:HEPN domain-containing protein
MTATGRGRWRAAAGPARYNCAGAGHGTLAGGKAVLDRSEYERWREAAAGARRAAEVQAASDIHNWGCFLAEQAAQLAVKSLLHGTGAGAWGHDLVALGERLREAADEELPDAVAAALRRLSRHYIPPRYPDAHPGGSPLAYYGTEDSAEAIADADRVIAHVDGLWERLLAAAAANSAEKKQDDGG